MELVPLKTSGGEAKAWEMLAEMNPARVCSGANVVHDASSEAYGVKAFGMDFSARTRDRAITSEDPRASLFLER